jgi:NitT/TauT family transport system permease protein
MSTQSARSRGVLPVVVPPILAVLAIVALWQLASSLEWVPQDMLPTPARIADQAWINREALASNTWPTLRATFLGFALSVVVALLIASLLDFFLVLRRAILPLLIVSQTLPIIAIAPLMILWFGFGLTPKILLQGFGSADPDAERLLRTMGASRWQVFTTIRFHAAMPFFFGGMRVSITYAVVSAIFAEYAGATSGLGVYMFAAKNAFRTDLVLAAVLVSSALTLLLFAVVALIGRLAIPWVRIEQGKDR